VKVIFLDFDGVIRTLRSTYTHRTPTGADTEAVAALNEIIAKTEAQIVVSSSWRGDRLSPLRDFLNEWGVKGKVVGKTPRLERREGSLLVCAPRGDEIQKWLDDYQEARGPVESFVVLDDEIVGGPVMNRLIQTEFNVGLTLEQAHKAIDLLMEATR